ncbi:MAG: ABC transporter ATP-binding protein/permease [Proteobacteria bacterium]|nr:ABC transporter ATP-binding protein/permease [Pseudomonadota bacterium]
MAVTDDAAAAAAETRASGPTLRRLIGYARPYAGLLLAVLVLALVFAGARNARNYLVKPLLDDVYGPAQVLLQDSDAAPLAGDAEGASELEARLLADLRTLLAAAAAILLIAPVALFGRLYLVQLALGRIAIDLRQDLAAKLLRLPLRHHRQARGGDTLTRALGDTDQSQRALDLLFGDFLQAGVMVAAGMVTLFIISWPLALVTLLAGPLIVGIMALFGERIQRTAQRRQEQMGEVTSRLLGILSGIKVIKAFRAEDREDAAFRRETTKLFRRSMKVVKNRVLSRSLVEAINNGLAVGVLVLGSLLVVRGVFGLTAGDLAAFVVVMATTYKPTKTLSKGFAGLMECLASAERFFTLLDTATDQADPPDAVQMRGIDRGILFTDVSFSYGREQVLRDVSFEIGAGEVVAVVGRTGSGKTTLVDLLLRFYEPDRGSIEIDGIDVRRIARTSLLDHVAVVSQESFLFDGTIRDNIRYGRPDAKDDEILEAARAAHVDEFAVELPHGYDTEVGEFGLKLSGGQRQRITIARAILRDPALLVFDEATSALDAKTERIVQDAIESLRGQRTVFVVAHRLSTIRRADRIVVLEDGAVSRIGRHDELVREDGLYRELVGLQSDSDDATPHPS